MLSHETTRKIRELQGKVEEVIQLFKCSREEAWLMLTANGGYKAADIAKRIQKRQDQVAEAERRAKAAYSSTFSSNVKYDEGDVT
jgi:hypothetical protein